MSLRQLVQHRYSDISSTSSSGSNAATPSNSNNLIGNIVVVCPCSDPFLDNEETTYTGNIQDLFLFENENDFDSENYRNCPKFAVIYAEKYNSNLRELKRRARSPCKNKLGGFAVKCKCLSVLRNNQTLLYQTAEMMTSFQICHIGSSLAIALDFEVDFSEEKVSKWMENVLQSLKLYSGADVTAPVSDMTGASIGIRGGRKRWNLYKFIEQHFPTSMDSKCEYNYVCTNAVMTIFGTNRYHWNKIVNNKKKRTNKKINIGGTKIQSRRSPRLNRDKVINYQEYSDEDNSSNESNSITSRMVQNENTQTARQKKSNMVSPEKNHNEANISNNYV